MIRLALIGAGIWAHDSLRPMLLALADRYMVVAVQSRTLDKAATLAQTFPNAPRATDDLDSVLGDPSIDAVVVAVPIPLLPTISEAALRSGKHVLSEKPIALDVATARYLMTLQQPGQVWMIGEQWRYEDALLKAQAMIRKGEIGDLILGHCPVFSSMAPGNKYFETTWRKRGGYPGGALLDGGIHRIAGLRMLMGDVVEVTAFMKQVREDLPPADTLAASLHFANGAMASFCATYAAGEWVREPMVVAGTCGSLRVERDLLEVVQGAERHLLDINPHQGVEAEFVDFANAIEHGTPYVSTALEAFRDLAVMEAMFKAAEVGRVVKVEHD